MGCHESLNTNVKLINKEATTGRDIYSINSSSRADYQQRQHAFNLGGYHNRGHGDAENHYMERETIGTGVVHSQSVAALAMPEDLAHASQPLQ